MGGGVEAAIGNGWSTRVEYLYLDLGAVSGTFASNVLSPDGVTPLTSGFHSHFTDNMVRAGLNYKFGGPVVAKY